MLRRILIAGGLLAALCALSIAGSWTTVTKRSLPFNAQRGSTSYVVIDSAAVYHTITVYKYVGDWPQDQIRFYDDAHFPADSATYNIDATNLGTSRRMWTVEDPPYGSYTGYEIGGSGADSAITGLAHIVFIGTEAPAASISTASLQDSSVDGNKISPASTIIAYKIKTDSLASATAGGRVGLGSAIRGDSLQADVLQTKTTGGRISLASALSGDSVRADILASKLTGGRIVVESGSSVQVDSIYGLTGTQVFFPDGKVYLGTATGLGSVFLSDANSHWLQMKNDWNNGTNRSWLTAPPVTSSWPDSNAVMHRIGFPGATAPYAVVGWSITGVGLDCVLSVTDSVDVTPKAVLDDGTTIILQIIPQ